MAYREDELMYVMKSENEGGLYKLKITSSTEETKWLQIDEAELEQIYQILGDK